MLQGHLGTASSAALVAYAGSAEVLGAKGALANAAQLDAGLRRLAGAVAATPEFQSW